MPTLLSYLKSGSYWLDRDIISRVTMIISAVSYARIGAELSNETTALLSTPANILKFLSLTAILSRPHLVSCVIYCAVAVQVLLPGFTNANVKTKVS